MKMLEGRRDEITDIGFIDPDKMHEVTVENPYANGETPEILLRYLKRQRDKKRNTFSLQFQVSVTVLYKFYFAHRPDVKF